MPTQRLLWTALPNGLSEDGSHLRLSVLLSPRLDPESQPNRLDTFGDFLRWPEVVRRARFTITIGAAEFVLRGSDADPALDVPDAATWDALFDAATRVRPFVFRDRTGHRVVSFDAEAAHDLVRTFHTAMVAASAGDAPTARDLLRPGSDVRGLVDAVGRADADSLGKREEGADGRVAPRMRDVEQQLAHYLDGGGRTARDPSRLLSAFQLFHTPMGAPTVQRYTEEQLARGREPDEVPDPTDPRRGAAWREYTPTPMPTAAAIAESLDFHQIVAAMNQYPRLLRRLGLALDFLLPRKPQGGIGPVVPSGNVTVRVEVVLPGRDRKSVV